ncbi:uncharacterized protein LOC135214090 [Macrobrachium nipponense]|uniref:uncharacterized protein LOC135214090 n=1 Tax=Macrobrachium nipponense TaxID=159736 RepID=UPI0030C7A8A9
MRETQSFVFVVLALPCFASHGNEGSHGGRFEIPGESSSGTGFPASSEDAYVITLAEWRKNAARLEYPLSLDAGYSVERDFSVSGTGSYDAFSARFPSGSQFPIADHAKTPASTEYNNALSTSNRYSALSSNPESAAGQSRGMTESPFSDKTAWDRIDSGVTYSSVPPSHFHVAAPHKEITEEFTHGLLEENEALRSHYSQRSPSSVHAENGGVPFDGSISGGMLDNGRFVSAVNSAPSGNVVYFLPSLDSGRVSQSKRSVFGSVSDRLSGASGFSSGGHSSPTIGNHLTPSIRSIHSKPTVNSGQFIPTEFDAGKFTGGALDVGRYVSSKHPGSASRHEHSVEHNQFTTGSSYSTPATDKQYIAQATGPVFASPSGRSIIGNGIVGKHHNPTYSTSSIQMGNSRMFKMSVGGESEIGDSVKNSVLNPFVHNEYSSPSATNGVTFPPREINASGLKGGAYKGNQASGQSSVSPSMNVGYSAPLASTGHSLFFVKGISEGSPFAMSKGREVGGDYPAQGTWGQTSLSHGNPSRGTNIDASGGRLHIGDGRSFTVTGGYSVSPAGRGGLKSNSGSSHGRSYNSSTTVVPGSLISSSRETYIGNGHIIYGK